MARLEIPAPFEGLVAGALDALDAYKVRQENGELMKLSEKATLFGQLMMLAGQFCAETMDRDRKEKEDD
jgi:hypothetical protein